MKKLILLVAVMLVLPFAQAASIGEGIGVSISTEEFPPHVWLCDSRVVYDDNVQWGRTSEGGQELVERNNNYIFEGEQVAWTVLVMDKNGIDKVVDVYGTFGDTQDIGDIEVNCRMVQPESSEIPDSCNARILEEELTEFVPALMGYYECTFTAETPVSMYGPYWLDIVAEDFDGILGTMDENEYWFFNPIIELGIEGSLDFDDVRPGTAAYSDTLLVENQADIGSGVLLDMFIAGTDFYDSSSSGAMCPTTNQLSLAAFSYYAVNGAYSTHDDEELDAQKYDPAVIRLADAEGYVNIQHGDHFDRTMYNEAEIIQANAINGGTLGYAANLLAPEAEMAITFRLMLPEPCNGDFDSGTIYFFGEAV